MILLNTPESAKEAQALLGITGARMGFRRVLKNGLGKYEPIIEKGDRCWFVRDEVLAEDQA